MTSNASRVAVIEVESPAWRVERQETAVALAPGRQIAPVRARPITRSDEPLLGRRLT